MAVILKERQNVPTFQLAADDQLASSINAVHLKDRFGDVETDAWMLLRIVGALTPPTSSALMCRWRSRPQHQKATELGLIEEPGKRSSMPVVDESE
jgi:hypothetical protein